MFENIFEDIENYVEEIFGKTEHHINCDDCNNRMEEGKVAINFNKQGVSEIHNDISEIESDDE